MVADDTLGLDESTGFRTSAQSVIAKVNTVPSAVEKPPSQPEEQHDLAESMSIATNNQSFRQEHESGRTPFWNFNIPSAEQTVDCPEYLAYALEDKKDRAVLSTRDGEYQRQTWEEIRAFIRENRLDRFTRVPSELRLYRKYCHMLVQDHGSIMKFVLEERLRWSELGTASRPFSNPDDYKILYNDWPYGVDERIVHLVVWTKFELPADPASEIGDMTPETREMVANFVNHTFVSICGPDNVIWFKNWQSIKSVHAVEHFHVMIFDPDMELVRTITNGDVPLFLKVKLANQDAAT